jgi:hypothetical protein
VARRTIYTSQGTPEPSGHPRMRERNRCLDPWRFLLMLRERDHSARAPRSRLAAVCSLRGARVGESDRLFFCGRGQGRLADQERAICAGCEVGECLEFALRNPHETEFGVWSVRLPPTLRGAIRNRLGAEQ